MSAEAKAAPRTQTQVQADRITQIADLAKHSFANHIVEPLWFGLPYGDSRHGPFEARAWLCHNPKCCAYHFTLYSVPGRLIICGDIGACVWERTRDMLAWARGSIDSIHYFAEKVVSEIETEEYDADMVRAWIHEMDQQILEDDRSEKYVKEWISGGLRAELLSAVEDGEHRVGEVYHESGFYDGDWPNWKNFTYRFLWQREAIKWFLKQQGS
jgi:hypothetical protein